MKSSRIWLPAVAFVLGHVFAADVPAQTYVYDSGERAWLGFSYDEAQVIREGGPVAVAVIDQVIAGSPAARAGIEPGDTIVGLNGRTFDRRAMAALGETLEPGDTVRLRARREGQERDVAVVAAERPFLVSVPRREPRVLVFDTDSLRRVVRVYMDSMQAHLDSARVHLDTLRLPYIRAHEAYQDAYVRAYPAPDVVQRLEETMQQRRSLERARVQLQELRNSLRERRAEPLWAYIDSVREDFELDRRPPGPRIPPVPAPIPWRGWEPPEPPFDSSEWGGFILPAEPDAFFGFDVGRRAVAGAEFSELNPGLARYFDVDEGLLVLRVAPGTPAALAGLEAGDVVVAAAGERVRSVTAFRWAVARADLPGPLELEVVREGELQRLQLQRE